MSKSSFIPRVDEAHLWYVQQGGGLDVLHACYQQYQFPKHSHEEYVIGLVEEGAEVCFYQGEEVVATPGTLTFINPEEVHTGGSGTNHAYRYRALYPTQSLLSQLWCDLTGHENYLPYFRVATARDEDAVRCIARLHRVLETSTSALERESLLLESLALLLRRYAHVRTESNPVRDMRRIQCAKEFMDAHLSENLSLEHIAAAVNLSPYYFARTFQQVAGLSPHSYLVQRRIACAKRLIRKKVSLAQVALESGFCDQGHLNRLFKRYLGITPTQYQIVF
jgi:AraC-like DNA-binding protein